MGYFGWIMYQHLCAIHYAGPSGVERRSLLYFARIHFVRICRFSSIDTECSTLYFKRIDLDSCKSPGENGFSDSPRICDPAHDLTLPTQWFVHADLRKSKSLLVKCECITLWLHGMEWNQFNMYSSSLLWTSDLGQTTKSGELFVHLLIRQLYGIKIKAAISLPFDLQIEKQWLPCSLFRIVILFEDIANYCLCMGNHVSNLTVWPKFSKVD